MYTKNTLILFMFLWLIPQMSLAQYTGNTGKGDVSTVLQATQMNLVYFTGEISADFSNGSNWSSGTFPVAGQIAEVRSGGTQPVLSGNQTITAGTTINILSGASLTIAPTGVLSVNGTVNNSGSIVIQSDSTGSGSIGNSAGTIVGNVTVQRFIPAVARRFRMFSAPIINYNYSQLIDDIFVTGPSGGIGFDATSHGNNPSVYTYQEDTAGGRGWKSFANINTTLSLGHGAIVFVRGDRSLPTPQWYTPPYVAQNAVTIDATGSLYFGSLTRNLTYTPTGNAVVDGVNLVGNPYASAIDWSTLTKNNLSNFFWIRNPATDAYEVQSSGTIASGQSFIVRAIGSNPSIQFNESDKSATINKGLFKTIAPYMEIKLVKDSITSDKLLLNFSPTANMGFQSSEDAIKFFNSSVNVYNTLNTVPIQLNSIPSIDLWASTDSVVFSTFVVPNGNYQINFNDLPNSNSGKQLWLHDRFTNTQFKLSNDTSFYINLTSDSASKHNRFALFTQSGSIVPVTWLKFEAVREDANAHLTWATANERNNNGFVIERRLLNEDNFTPIGNVKGAGNNSGIKTYKFKDEGVFNLPDNACFYRIKQVDNDGSYSYSNIIKLTRSNPLNHKFIVYPNATTKGQMAIVQSIDISDAAFNLIVADGLGQELLTYKTTNGEILLDSNTLPAGIYYLEVRLNGIGNYIERIKWMIK